MTEVNNEIIDKETKEILDELEQEGHEVVRPDKTPKSEDEGQPKSDDKPNQPTPPKKEEKPKEEPPKKPEGEEGGEDGGEEDPENPEKDTRKTGRQPKFVTVPAWKLNISKKREQQIRDEERAKFLEEQRNKGQSNGNDTPSPKPEESPEIKALADEMGIEPTAVLKLVGIVQKGLKTDLPADVKQKLDKIGEIEQERQDNFEEAEYSKEFERDVLPLVKAEYPDISTDALSTIRQKLHDLAFTEDYSKVALKMLYRGEDSFRSLYRPKKETTEPGRGGSDRNAEVKDWENLSEDDVAQLSEKDFEEYSDFMAKRERGIRK